LGLVVRNQPDGRTLVPARKRCFSLGTPGDEIDTVHHPRRAEQRTCGSPGERMLFDAKSARRQLALQDLTNSLMIGCAYETPDREVAEQLGVISHRVRAR